MNSRTLIHGIAVATLLLATLSRVARAEAGDGFAVTPGQVALAMRRAHVPADVGDVRFLSAVWARVPDPSLKLISIAKWETGTLKAELRCADRGACLPFYILLRDAGSAIDVRTAPIHEEARPIRLPVRHAVHTGERAMLVFENGDSRIQMRVICAQNGDRGQKIRVASIDRKRFYQAEVVEPGLLKGIL